MTKSEKNEFLANGGALIRKGISPKGDQIIKVRTKDKDWHPLKDRKFNNATERDKHFDALLESNIVKED